MSLYNALLVSIDMVNAKIIVILNKCLFMRARKKRRTMKYHPQSGSAIPSSIFLMQHAVLDVIKSIEFVIDTPGPWEKDKVVTNVEKCHQLVDFVTKDVAIELVPDVKNLWKLVEAMASTFYAYAGSTPLTEPSCTELALEQSLLAIGGPDLAIERTQMAVARSEATIQLRESDNRKTGYLLCLSLLVMGSLYMIQFIAGYVTDYTDLSCDISQLL